MQIGLALARTGVLNELGRLADNERGRALERRRRTQEQGGRVGAARAARFRDHRERRARELGFADVDALARQRYLVEGGSVAEIADALGCAQITLIDEMERLGIPRRAENERLVLGRAVLAERHAEAARALQARDRELGFPDVRANLSDRIAARRWRQVDAAAELGVHVSRIRKLIRQHGVRSARAAAPADQSDPDGYQLQRLSAAQRALAARRRARDDEIARRLGFADIAAWYAGRRAAGAINREMKEVAGWARSGCAGSHANHDNDG